MDASILIPIVSTIPHLSCLLRWQRILWLTSCPILWTCGEHHAPNASISLKGFAVLSDYANSLALAPLGRDDDMMTRSRRHETVLCRISRPGHAAMSSISRIASRQKVTPFASEVALTNLLSLVAYTKLWTVSMALKLTRPPGSGDHHLCSQTAARAERLRLESRLRRKPGEAFGCHCVKV